MLGSTEIRKSLSPVGADHRPPVFVLWVAAGLIGGLYCWFRHPAGGLVEMLTYARFVAGITVYPENSPMAFGLATTVTPFHVLLAKALSTGVTDRMISLMLNVLTSAAYAQGFALLCLALGGRVLPALVLGVLPVLTQAFVEGADYPINTFNGPVLGNMGFCLLLQFLGLLGCGRGGGALLVALVIGLMHPVFGLMAAGLSVLGLLAARRWPERMAVPLDWRGLVAVAALVAVAWAAARASVPAVAPLPPVEPHWVAIYLDRWDYHRNVPVDERSLAIAVQAVLATVLIAVLLARPAARLGRPAATLAVMLAVGGGLACLGWGLFHALRPWLPAMLVLPMPNRFMNLPEAAALAALAAALPLVRPRPLRLAAWALLGGTALFAAVATGDRLIDVPIIKAVERAAVIPLLVLGLWAVWRSREEDGGERRTDRPTALAARPRARLAAAAAAAAGAALLFTVGQPEEIDNEATRLMAQLERTQAVMVAQDALNPAFLPIRNPFLIDTNQMDLLPYVPQLIPVYARILKEIYGIDFLYPPSGTYREGQVKAGASRAVWAARPREEWLVLGRKWGVRFILTKPDLQLPLNGVTMNDMAIWEIPPPGQ